MNVNGLKGFFKNNNKKKKKVDYKTTEVMSGLPYSYGGGGGGGGCKVITKYTIGKLSTLLRPKSSL